MKTKECVITIGFCFGIYWTPSTFFFLVRRNDLTALTSLRSDLRANMGLSSTKDVHLVWIGSFWMFGRFPINVLLFQHFYDLHILSHLRSYLASSNV